MENAHEHREQIARAGDYIFQKDHVFIFLLFFSNELLSLKSPLGNNLVNKGIGILSLARMIDGGQCPSVE